ncbi:MAG: DUF3037 domain-containing protein [Terriglobia bacterium]
MTETPAYKSCSYFVIRYAADLLRDEALNIGVLLHCPEDHYLGCLLAGDFRWLRRFHRDADLELLRELQNDFERQIEIHEADQKGYFQALGESLSNTIRLEGPRLCLVRDPTVEIGDLYARNVGRGAAKLAPEDSRLRIKQRLTAALVRAKVWDRIEKRIPAERWTQPGDPFTFDYGYQPNGAIHLIHALSLKRDTQLAKTLVYSFDCVRRRDQAALTVVADELPGAGDRIARATEGILAEAGIAVQPLAGIEAFAQSVRAEMRI